MRHNELRNITADLLTEVCLGVGVEPHLQPVTEEQITHELQIVKKGLEWTSSMKTSGVETGNARSSM